jgi:hypothetical protein
MNPDLKDDETYIYESPDGGKTVYARLFGDDPSNRFQVQVSEDGAISWNNPWEDKPAVDTYLIDRYPELKEKFKEYKELEQHYKAWSLLEQKG